MNDVFAIMRPGEAFEVEFAGHLVLFVRAPERKRRGGKCWDWHIPYFQYY